MKTVSYADIPSKSQFQTDSSVTFAFRSSDRILMHLDWLLERYAHWMKQSEFYSIRRVILSDLFLTCNYWIKGYHDNFNNKGSLFLKDRYPAVLGLFEAVVNRLCLLLGCTRGGLVATLDEMFGRELSSHGALIDNYGLNAKYLEGKAKEIYRLKFKGGLAHQYQWWNEKSSAALVPAESRRAFLRVQRNNPGGGGVPCQPTFDNWGGFVMTLERGIYMAKHTLDGDGNDARGFYHSSYTAGGRITMAGTMLIKRGRILGVRADSGHYQPTNMNMTFFLQALGMLGIELRNLPVWDYTGNHSVKAIEFMKGTLTWSKFTEQAKNEVGRRPNANGAPVVNPAPAMAPLVNPSGSSEEGFYQT